jgi:hypothetical protein
MVDKIDPPIGGAQPGAAQPAAGATGQYARDRSGTAATEQPDVAKAADTGEWNRGKRESAVADERTKRAKVTPEMRLETAARVYAGIFAQQGLHTSVKAAAAHAIEAADALVEALDEKEKAEIQAVEDRKLEAKKAEEKKREEDKAAKQEGRRAAAQSGDDLLHAR